MRKPEMNTPVEKRFATVARKSLVDSIGEVVTIEFRKRDDETVRVMTGKVVELKGEGDKEVVIMETDKGYRSASLVRINRHVRK